MRLMGTEDTLSLTSLKCQLPPRGEQCLRGISCNAVEIGVEAIRMKELGNKDEIHGRSQTRQVAHLTLL